MTYKLQHNGRTYYVETERHGYRTRFYAIDITGEWDRMGYIGSYYPGSKSCGYSDQSGHDFSIDARGPKTAARACLAWYIDNVKNPAEWNKQQTGGY